MRLVRFGLAVAVALMLAVAAHAAVPGRAIELPGLAVDAARFEEPLVPTVETSDAEDAALEAAITRFHAASAPDDFSALEGFLASHPQSGWRLAVLTNLGLSYLHYGYLSRSVEAFDQAWQAGQSATEIHAKALADRAGGELLLMHARLAHTEVLAALLDQMAGRGLSGRASEWRDDATEALRRLRNNAGTACGVTALRNVLLTGGDTPQQVSFLDTYRPGAEGVPLAEIGRLAEKAGLPYRLIHRTAGEPIPVPSVLHWKVKHFSAIVGEHDGRYELMDPTFGTPRMWVTRAAIEAESSGYFLVPGAATGAGWRDVPVAEAEEVRGKGYTPQGNEPGKTGGSQTQCQCTGTGGMTTYSFTEMVTSLLLTDTPVGYAPPKGPPVRTQVTYNQREASQPSNFSFYNVSQKWSLNWQTYVEDDPTNPGNSVMLVQGGGGYETYSGYTTTTGAFAPEVDTGAILSESTSGPVTYTRTFPDGSRDVYGASNGATSYPRLIFLTKRIDRYGNAVTLTYDNQQRLTTIVDATGRSTTFAYGNATFPLQVTAVTDPFGRSAQFAYDSAGRLIQITDVLGIKSQYAYDSSSLVNALTTPYGTTTFIYGTESDGNTRYVQATDPLGYTERDEYNENVTAVQGPEAVVPTGMLNLYNIYLIYRNTFYWDKHAYAVAKGDYTKAHLRHWAHLAPSGDQTSNTLESERYPLENRIWYTYPGQTSGAFYSGTSNTPTGIGRVLDDGTTQLTQMQYNSLSNPTSIIDPSGRTTTLQYAANQIDVTAVQQTTASGPATTASFTYNGQHLPLTSTDAAGKTTHYSYNSAGQVTSVTDPLGETTAFNYNALGYLLSIVNANGKTAASFTYDSLGRIATRTDSEGWTVTYAYDAADRVTTETYPDGTTRVYSYTNLDLTAVTDRQGRKTSYAYDANRELISVTDPLGQVTKLGYYENGKPKTLTDPNGHVTTWGTDVQSRVVSKTYPDGKVFANTYENTTSRLHGVTDALGQTKQYGYALDNRLTGIQYLHAVNATPSVSFAYDPYFPRRTSMTDGSGVTSYAYGAVGALGALKLALETPPFANSAIAYTYDALGRVVSRGVGGDPETVTYDALGRVTTHVDGLGTFQRAYVGQTTQVTSQTSGLVGTRWFYDTNLNDRRLTQIVNTPLGSGFTYKTTPENDITSITETTGSQTWSYTYDLADRLTKATSSVGPVYQYGYDAASNLGSVQRPSGTTTVVTNSDNEVTTAGGKAFTYDANGNLLSDATRTYKWDAENRLIGISYPGQAGVSSAFSYDGLGRRIAIVTMSGGASTPAHYGWCGETLCQARAANDAVTRRYFDEGEKSFANESLFYYGVDHLGSVHDVISLPSGLRSNQYDYEPYGSPTQNLGSATTGADFRYAGLFYHQQSGLYLATYRAYDPTTGRWLSRDPIEEKGGDNLYAYVLGNPLRSTDPWGQASNWKVVACLLLGLCAADPNPSQTDPDQYHWKPKQITQQQQCKPLVEPNTPVQGPNPTPPTEAAPPPEIPPVPLPLLLGPPPSFFPFIIINPCLVDPGFCGSDGSA